VPVCWPQFSDFGPLQQHGFARNQAWTLLSSGGASEHGAFAVLELRDDDATRATWPHAFALRLRLSLSEAGALRMDFDVENTGPEALSFTFAAHTYFRVADAAQASVLGLAGTTYLDSLQGRTRCTEASDAVGFDKEVDRIYLAVPSRLQLADKAAARTVTLEMRGLPDAVVWNPWIAKAAAMADFGAPRVVAERCVRAVPERQTRRTTQATRSTRRWFASRRQLWNMPSALRPARPGRRDKP
jgi:glucose-6-phosphate 1-epimerase